MLMTPSVLVCGRVCLSGRKKWHQMEDASAAGVMRKSEHYSWLKFASIVGVQIFAATMIGYFWHSALHRLSSSYELFCHILHVRVRITDAGAYHVIVMISSLFCRLLERTPQKLWQASNVLVLAMAHTTVTDPKSKKQSNPHIKFDVELDLVPFMHDQSPELSSGSSLKYELIAVVQRIGKDAQSGHFVAYCNTNGGSGEIPCNAIFA